MDFGSLINYLSKNETAYVDEIDRLIRSPADVKIIPENLVENGGGWIYLSGEPGSGDWNLARMIGIPQKAFDCLAFLPEAEINLLLPENVFIGQSNNLQQLSRLCFFIDDCCTENAEIELLSMQQAIEEEFCKSGFSLRTRYFDIDKLSDDGGFLDGIYLLNKEAVKGYVKVVRRSPGCNEVYIEIEPALRNCGTGSGLLKYAVFECHKKKKKLIYAVDEENLASIATARRAGLKHFQTLSRFLLAKAP